MISRDSVLLVDSKPEAITADWSISFVDKPGGLPEPVLYHKGVRVTKKWWLSLVAVRGEDKNGASAGGELAANR